MGDSYRRNVVSLRKRALNDSYCGSVVKYVGTWGSVLLWKCCEVCGNLGVNLLVEVYNCKGKRT